MNIVDALTTAPHVAYSLELLGMHTQSPLPTFPEPRGRWKLVSPGAS